MRLPWRLDLTSLAGPGSVHDLLLFTHNCTGPYAHPTRTSLSEDAETALDTRFWRTSAATIGLESDVHLSLESRVRIEDVHVTTSVREGVAHRRTDGAQRRRRDLSRARSGCGSGARAGPCWSCRVAPSRWRRGRLSA